MPASLSRRSSASSTIQSGSAGWWRASYHHDRPALAGVICEFEHRQDVDQFFRTNDGHVTTRFRQAIGVVVRIIMESHGWQTTGRKGSLGVRGKVPTRTETSGAYHNTGGLALWFTRAERYVLVAGMPYRSVEERAAEIDLSHGRPVNDVNDKSDF